ncbi:MAG: hypothetical protein GXO74_10615 [Calditrichaeota bacterium]|nr:hypothetical protein [Calditrichota bacterium]
MRIFSIIGVAFLLIFSSIFGQEKADTTKAARDTLRQTKAVRSLVLKPKPKFQQPTMPKIPTISEKEARLNFDVRSQYRATHPEETHNFDALNRPDSYKYQTPYRQPVLKPNIPVTPLEVKEKPFFQSLPLNKYTLPTREETDVLEILWAKENVMDTTIYSSLDTTMNITFEDLNKLLDRITAKGLVSRRIVSPRNEFNMFGVLIEMSPTNRRNRVYEYRSNVDRELMRKFVDANAYLVSKDSTLLGKKHLRAAQKDSTLLRDLNLKLNRNVKSVRK